MGLNQFESEMRAVQMRQLVQGLVIEELMRLIPPNEMAAALARLSCRLDDEVLKRKKTLGTSEDEAMTGELVRILGATVVMPTVPDTVANDAAADGRRH